MTSPAGGPAPAPRRAPDHRRHATLLGLGAAILNLNFVIELALPHHGPLRSTMVSDLAVHGRPWFWVFRLTDGLSAVLLLAVGGLALRATRSAQRGSRTWRTAAVLLAGFAASTLLAAIVPEACSFERCGSGAGPAWQSTVHEVVSTVGTAAGIGSCLAFALATRRHRLESVGHLAAFVTSAVLGSAFVVAQVSDSLTDLGYPQRAQIVVLSVWFVLVGRSVDRSSAGGSSAGRPDRAAGGGRPPRWTVPGPAGR